MRILLDECMPVRFSEDIPGHEVRTIKGLGWLGTKNGALLRRAAREFDAFITVDRGIRQQQQIPSGLAVILMRVPSNNRRFLTPYVPRLLEALRIAQAGTVTELSSAS